MKLRYERGALADLDEVFAYIAADSREAAGRLVARIERVATRIAASLATPGTDHQMGPDRVLRAQPPSSVSLAVRHSSTRSITVCRPSGFNRTLHAASEVVLNSHKQNIRLLFRVNADMEGPSFAALQNLRLFVCAKQYIAPERAVELRKIEATRMVLVAMRRDGKMRSENVW
jgi:plasmid stabilization system protein ParE